MHTIGSCNLQTLDRTLRIARWSHLPISIVFHLRASAIDIDAIALASSSIAGCTFPVLSPRGCLPDHSVAVASSISLFRSGGKHDQRKPHRTFSGKNCGSHFPCECVLVAPSVSTQFVKAGTTDENPVAPSVCVYSGCGVLSFPFRVAASTSRRRRSHGKRASEDYSSRKSR